MDRPRLPWRTGEDTRSRVLERVLRDAVRRPEIGPELAPGGDEEDAFDAANKVVSEVRASVLAAGEPAETRYRELVYRTKLFPFNNWIEKFPLVGELITLVLIPLTGVVALLAIVTRVGVGARPWVLTCLILSLAVSGWVLWHKRSRDSMSVPARAWAWFGLVASSVGNGWTWLGMDDGQLTLGLLSIAVTIVAVTAVIRTVFPSTRLRARRRALLSAFEEWCQTLLRDGVLPVLFTKINAASVQTYSTNLTARDTRALIRANPLSMHVPTPASRTLTRLVDQLGGGSFALAGPRGAGKSNLLKAFCGGRYRDDKRHPDLAVLVSAPVEYVPHEFVLHLFGATCRAAIAYPERLTGLTATARENLDLLSYVHSYAREITAKGGFKGFELGRKRGVTLQGRALTYPELVDRFREFLRDAVTALVTEAKRDGKEPGRVVIGIDELDRLGSGEPARRFLNELKAIFDVTGCYYLVSVSTEAQHDFELSGMGLRSVFDSSFDEVVRVDYLDFEHAKKLLRRYMIGLSEQFLALAYVFSGGLARQLVRTARMITEYGREHPHAPLPAVVQELARHEVIKTCQATVDVLASAEERTDLLQTLDDPPTKIASDELRSYADRVRQAYQGDSEQVRKLRDGVKDRVCFLATVLDVFTNRLTERRMHGVDFDALAKTRRYLG